MATAKKELSADTQATVLHQDAEHTVYRLDGTDGEVVQTVYPVFPGIEIAYHDVHATACAMQRAHAPGCLEIHHCREGRIAYPYGGACFFLAPGRPGDRAALSGGGSGALSDRALPRHHGIDRPGARAGLPVVLSRRRRGAAECADRKILCGRSLLRHALVAGRGAHFLRALFRAGRHPQGLFQGQNSGAAAVFERVPHAGGRSRSTVIRSRRYSLPSRSARTCWRTRSGG